MCESVSFKSICVPEEVAKSIDEGRVVDIVCMDISQAFDKVPHDRLAWKVRSQGIQGEPANWIHLWPDSSKQRLMVISCFPDWRPVTSALPQRSVLDPLLFIIDVNDLAKNVQGTINEFAGDVTIGGIINSENDYQKLLRDLEQLGKWAEEWQMAYHSDKCEMLHIEKLNQGPACTILGS